MPAERIFHIPFWYEAEVIWPKRRKPENVILRDSVPVAIRIFGSEDAPPHVTIELLKALPEWTSHKRINLRHDGKVFLQQTDATERDLESICELENTKLDIPDLGHLLTANNHRLERFEGRERRRVICRPADFKTEDQIVVRELTSSCKEEAKLEVVRKMSGFAIIEGRLFEPVPAPEWCFDLDGNADLFEGDNWLSYHKAHSLPGVLWWQLPRYEEFERHVNANSEVPCRVVFDGPPAALAGDANLQYVQQAQSALLELHDLIEAAIHHLSDAGVRRYPDFRSAAAKAAEGDLDACRAAFRELRAMVDDAGVDGGDHWNLEQLRKGAITHVELWEKTMSQAGLEAPDPTDEAAIAFLV